MLYSEFVKEQMMKMKGVDMTALQKMKHIAEQWKKSKEMPKKEMPKKEMPKKESTKPRQKKHSNEILTMLGVDVKKAKAKPKSERAIKKVVKAMEKMQIPIEEKIEVVKHPVHLLEKEEVKHKKMFEDDDIGF